jgi:hypothetical protein
MSAPLNKALISALSDFLAFHPTFYTSSGVKFGRFCFVNQPPEDSIRSQEICLTEIQSPTFRFQTGDTFHSTTLSFRHRRFS